jgi:hypothetical protein
LLLSGYSRQLKRLPAWNVLLRILHAYLCWLSTILEGFFWPVLLNHLEHLSYAASSAFDGLVLEMVNKRKGSCLMHSVAISISFHVCLTAMVIL